MERDPASVQTRFETSRTLRLSLIIAMYRVAEYLPDLLRSIDDQDLTGVELELIFVDDGSPDESGQIAQDWLSARDIRGRVITQPNGGVAHARNSGLDAATGDWVGFPDPDDLLAPGYVAVVREHVQSLPADVDVVSTRLVVFSETDAKIRDSHSLRYRFANGTCVIDLSREPSGFQLHASSSVFRRARVESLGLRFIEGLPLSEDSVFIQRLLLAADVPKISMLCEAQYIYRKRSRGDSAIDGSATNPAAYLERFEKGYAPLLDGLGEAPTPGWLTFVMLYELAWLMRAETRVRTRSRFLSAEQKARFRALAQRCLARVDPADILRFGALPMTYESRLMLFAFAGIDGRAAFDRRVAVKRVDRERGLVQVTYFHLGDTPQESFRVAGREVAPAFGKRRRLSFFDQRLLFQRIVWIPAESDDLAVTIDGVQHEIVDGTIATPEFVLEHLEPSHANAGDAPAPVRITEVPALRRWVPGPQRRSRGLLRRVRKALGRRKRRLQFFLGDESKGTKTQLAARAAARAPRLRRLASTPQVISLYRDAWVFMDRVTSGGDNAEHLYRFVRQRHPEINAWFVLSRRHAADWARLKAEGFRLVDYGSDEHVALMLNATHYLSSQIDVNVVDPVGPGLYTARPWKFTFLQHGVTQHDLSDWFNTKDIDLFLSVTPDEHAAFVADQTPYELTEKETRRLGFPRHDALLDKRRSTEASGRRRVVLVAPTWRDSLLKSAKAANTMRLVADDFGSSAFVQAWRSAMNSPAMTRLISEPGVEVVFLPHPGFQDAVDAFSLPPEVRVVRYSSADVQTLLAEALVVITDYSSLAFDAAAVDAPVIYYQFDREGVYHGNLHYVVAGYFDFFTDGFGPVAETVDEFDRALGDLAAAGFASAEIYAKRRVAAFDLVDGGACSRVVDAVRSLTTAVGR